MEEGVAYDHRIPLKNMHLDSDTYRALYACLF
jgi:hypothetical protein